MNMTRTNLIRGTTPTLTFTLPITAEQVAAAFITVAQNGETVLETQTGTTECTYEQNSIVWHLTQEETLKLESSGDGTVKIQIRLRTNDGEALASQIIPTSVAGILKDGVI